MARHMADLQVYYEYGQDSLACYYVQAYRLRALVEHWRATLQRRGDAALQHGNETVAFTMWSMSEWLGGASCVS